MDEKDLLSKIAISKDGLELGKISKVIGKERNFRLFKKEQIELELTQHVQDDIYRISLLTCDIAQIDGTKIWLDITAKEFNSLVRDQMNKEEEKDKNSQAKNQLFRKILD